MIHKIECPKCNGAAKSVVDWLWKYSQTDDGLYYFKCQHCKTPLGSTMAYQGSLAIWEKSKEKK